MAPRAYSCPEAATPQACHCSAQAGAQQPTSSAPEAETEGGTAAMQCHAAGAGGAGRGVWQALQPRLRHIWHTPARGQGGAAGRGLSTGRRRGARSSATSPTTPAAAPQVPLWRQHRQPVPEDGCRLHARCLALCPK